MMDRTPEIGLLLYPGVQRAAVDGLTDLLTLADGIGRRTLKSANPLLHVSHIAQRPSETGLIRTFKTEAGGFRNPSFLVLPPSLAEPPGREQLGGILNFLASHHARGATLASICAGTFALAETGLLNGRHVTTHWAYGPRLAQQFPEVHVDVARLIIDDFDIITAGGMMAWIDLGLTIVERVLGTTTMLETARSLVVDPPRREQLSYNVFSPSVTHGDEGILIVQQWLRSTALHDITATAMARHAGMEERTFFRRFRRATGVTPLEYCHQLRVARARELLERTRRPVGQISWDSGYQDVATFRRTFARITGLSPTDYRRLMVATDTTAGRDHEAKPVAIF